MPVQPVGHLWQKTSSLPVPCTTCQLNFNLGNLNNLCGSSHPEDDLFISCYSSCLCCLSSSLSPSPSASPSVCLSRFLHCLGTFPVQANWHATRQRQQQQQVLCFHRRFLMPFSAYFMCSLAPGTVGRSQIPGTTPEFMFSGIKTFSMQIEMEMQHFLNQKKSAKHLNLTLQ